METTDFKALFERYIAGRATEEEVRQLLDYFRLEKESEILTVLVVQEMANPVSTDAATLKQREPVYQRVQDALHFRIDAEQEAIIVSLWKRSLYKIAAAIIIIAAGGIAVWQWANKAPEMIAVNVPYGHIREIVLPDSSHIWLNAGSKFTYPSAFKGDQRQVKLIEGQAFFQVVHKDRQPFIVTANGMSISVLGTSFDIKAFTNESDAKVSVATGKVGVALPGAGQATTYLLPDEQAVLHRGSNKLIKVHVHTDFSAWRNNQLVFENESLDNVFNALERKYNVHVVVQTPKLLNEITSMKLNNQPLSDVLTALSFSKHFQYQLTNDSTVIVK